MTRREPRTLPSSAAAGAAPSRSPVLASGCHGRTSRGVTITMRPTPGAWPRASTLATPHAWLRSSLPSSAGPPPGSVAIRLRARARARAHTHTRAHAHTHAHTCSHVCSFLLPRLAFCPTCALDSCCASRVPSLLMPPQNMVVRFERVPLGSAAGARSPLFNS